MKAPTTGTWTNHPKYEDAFENWFHMSPEKRALEQEYLKLAQVHDEQFKSTPHAALLSVIEKNEAERKYREDYAALQARLKAQFDRDCADLRERFEACKFVER